MYSVIYTYFGTTSQEFFKTESKAWKRYASLYNHFLDNGNATLKMIDKNGNVLYYDVF